METGELFAIVDNVVSRFQRHGLPVGIEAEDLRHDGYVAASGLIGSPPDVIARAVAHDIQDAIRANRAYERNIQQFVQDSERDLKHPKSYHKPNTITDPWTLLPVCQFSKEPGRNLQRARPDQGSTLAARYYAWRLRRERLAGAMVSRKRAAVTAQ